MKKWSSFFFILAILLILLALLCIMVNIALTIGVLIVSVCMFFTSSVCDAVVEHMANQKEIIKNQQKIIIMLDNMKE